MNITTKTFGELKLKVRNITEHLIYIYNYGNVSKVSFYCQLMKKEGKIEEEFHYKLKEN